MKIKINGQFKEINGVNTISELLDNLGLSSKKVVVELNREIVEPKDFSTKQINDGDMIEIVHFVGGG